MLVTHTTAVEEMVLLRVDRKVETKVLDIPEILQKDHQEHRQVRLICLLQQEELRPGLILTVQEATKHFLDQLEKNLAFTAEDREVQTRRHLLTEEANQGLTQEQKLVDQIPRKDLVDHHQGQEQRLLIGAIAIDRKQDHPTGLRTTDHLQDHQADLPIDPLLGLQVEAQVADRVAHEAQVDLDLPEEEEEDR